MSVSLRASSKAQLQRFEDRITHRLCKDMALELSFRYLKTKLKEEHLEMEEVKKIKKGENLYFGD